MMNSRQNTVLAFSRFRFVAEQHLLLVDGRAAPLPPKAAALLALLIHNRGQLVEKETIMQELWPDTFVEESNLTQHISTLRKVLGDDFIQTVPRRGYRFIAEVQDESNGGGHPRRWWIGATALGGVLLTVTGRQFFQTRAQSSVHSRSEAYELYLKGHSCYWERRSADNVRRAIAYFERARDIDPDCALAWAGLADGYSSTLWYFAKLPPRELMPKAKMAAERAVKLDPRLAWAHTALANEKFLYEWDWAGAEREFRSALSLDANDGYSHALYGVFLASLHRVDEAIDQTNRAQQLEPNSPFIRFVTGHVLDLLSRHDQALEAYRKVLDLDPRYDPAHWCMHESYLAKRMYDQALAEFVKACGPREATEVREAFEADGVRGLWQTQVKFTPEEQSVRLARLALRLGQPDEGMRLLERAYEERDPNLTMIPIHRDFDPVRSDPRFVALLQRMGLPAQTPLTSR